MLQVKLHQIYQNLNLPASKNCLSFGYIGIHHRNTQSVVYQYKLTGLDEKWSNPTSSNEAIYTNLPAGDYTFMVRASTKCGNWGKNTLQYSFSIKPPFWRSWWFIVLTISTIVASVFSLQRIYTNYQTRRALAFERMKQEAESLVRKQIVLDFHDELCNKLAAITTQASVLQLKMNSDNENKKIVNEIESNALMLYANTKDFIWTIDPESNRLNELIMYIKDFGEKLF